MYMDRSINDNCTVVVMSEFILLKMMTSINIARKWNSHMIKMLDLEWSTMYLTA